MVYSYLQYEKIEFSEFSPSTKDRLINLYWMRITTDKNSTIKDEDYYSNKREDLVLEYLRSKKYTQEHIRRDAEGLTEKKYTDWIEDFNIRQHEFILNALDRMNNLKKAIRYNRISCIGAGKILCTTIFDTLQQNIHTRNKIIPLIINSWNDTIMQDKIFSWFETNTEEKTICALNWFKRNEPANTIKIVTHDPLQTIIILFDKLYPHKDTKQIKINKIKRSFTNKNNHKNSTYTKSPIYIELSEHHKKSLKEIAKSRNMTMRKLVEYWIDMAIEGRGY